MDRFLDLGDESFAEQKILLVDDNPKNLLLAKTILKPLDVDILTAESGKEALELLESEKPVDLMLLDLMMPEMDGFDVLEEMNRRDLMENTSVIILTALHDVHDKVKALSLGAVDYITKPFVKKELLARIRLHLSLRYYHNKLQNYAGYLEVLVEERTEELKRTQDIIAISLARLAESRDPETGDHLERMSRYSGVIAKVLTGKAGVTPHIDEAYASMLEKVAVLHDIGKVAIPDRILLKPGRLTREEFEIMKTHTVHGGDTLAKAIMQVGKPIPYLIMAKEVAYYHHEKWNGKGYPIGLKGTNIPLSARIVAIADVYDALRSRRVYKPPFSHEKARRIILEERGQQFDPMIVDAFLEVEDQIIEIHHQFPQEI